VMARWDGSFPMPAAAPEHVAYRAEPSR
jgi:hypothetical protein